MISETVRQYDTVKQHSKEVHDVYAIRLKILAKIKEEDLRSVYDLLVLSEDVPFLKDLCGCFKNDKMNDFINQRLMELEK